MVEKYFIQDAIRELYFSMDTSWIPFDCEICRSFDSKEEAKMFLERYPDKFIGVFAIKYFVINNQ